MKREFINTLYAHRGLVGSTECSPMLVPGCPVDVPGDKPKVSLMSTIFARDPLSNKPCNDLVMVLSEHLPGNVRDWIKQNLQAPVAPDTPVPDFEGADDLRRQPGETEFMYMNRLKEIALDGEFLIKNDAKRVRTAKKSASKSKE